MDPITIGLMGVGLGMQIFGGMGASEKANQIAGVQAGIAQNEGKINDVRRQQMQFEARRSQLEIFRNAQRARAQGLNASVNQGASQGSGIQGGMAQTKSMGLFNSQGVETNLAYGQNIFGIQGDITKQKMQVSQLGGEMATDQGIASLGGSLFKAGPTIGNIAQGVGTSGIKVPGFNPFAGMLA